MHNANRRGLAYNRSIMQLNYLFLLSRMRSQNYTEYILFKKKNKHSYDMMGEYSGVAIIILIIFFRFWRTDIVAYILPNNYLALIIALLFQKQVVFFIKVTIWPVAWILNILYRCIFIAKCRCGKKKQRA
jgi:hypothetical protein